MTKVDIISGFLGAGKTTFIKELIAKVYRDEKIVLIENEFGEIGIDSHFMQDSGIEVTEMNSGCICCTLVGDFARSLREVSEKFHPDRIIIEPSGVGKLSDVAKAVIDMEEEADVEIDSLITVVDGKKAAMYMKNFGEFFSNQIEYAGTIILSRTDTEKATQEKVEAAVELIRSLNKTAAVITTPIAQLSGEKILNTMEHNTSLEKELMEEETCPVCGGHHHHHDHEGCDHDHEECDHHHHHDHEECDHDHHHHDHEECGHEHHHDHEECGHEHHHSHDHHHGHHHADEVFTSWGKETVKAYSQEEIQKILDTLSEDGSYGMVLRAKGMVEGKDGQWIYFDMVPGEADIRQGAPDYTGRLCVIGSKLAEDKLAELFGV